MSEGYIAGVFFAYHKDGIICPEDGFAYSKDKNIIGKPPLDLPEIPN
jgi:hypothetical protein